MAERVTPAGAPNNEDVTHWGDEPVRVVPYDPAWPRRFERESGMLEAAIGDWAVGGIHHVGSTSVLGLAAKPVIDILVGVRDLASSRGCFEPLSRLGYLYAPYRAEEMHWFCKPSPSRRTHHLHLVPMTRSDSARSSRSATHLRSHPGQAGEYAALKRRLACEFEHDREAYTEAKAALIREVLDRAVVETRTD